MNLRKNAPADEPVVVPDGGDGSRTKLLVAGGVAAGLAVVAGMSYLLLSGGSDTVPTQFVPPARAAAAAAKPAAQAPAVAAPAIKKFTGTNARDPFKPLVVEPVAAAGSTGTTSGTTSGTTTGSTAGTTSGTTSGTTTGTTTGTTSGTTSGTTGSTPIVGITVIRRSATPITISLVSVTSTDTAADFTIGTRAFNGVKPQDTFATYFKLLNLTSGKCGAVQYGDVSFVMCEGDSLTLR